MVAELFSHDFNAGDLQDPIEDGGTDSIYVWPIFQAYHWIGFLGKILTGNPWVFTIKLIGLSG